MKQRKLGHSGLEVSAIGFACMGTSKRIDQGATALSRNAQIAVIRAAHDFGVTFFNTTGIGPANPCPFNCEELVGEAVAPFRHKIIVTTAFGFTLQDHRVVGLDSRPEQIRKQAEASLKRLNVETIDLFCQHRVDPNVPIEDVAGTVQDLIQQGKVRHFGLCEASAATLRRAHAVQPVSVMQAEYSLLQRAPEHSGILQTVEDLGIGFVASSPLGSGLLARPPCLPLLPETRSPLEANQLALASIAQLAERKYATVAQTTLAWLLAQKPWIVPMPSTHRIGHLDENLGAADLVLSAEDMQIIDDALTPH